MGVVSRTRYREPCRASDSLARLPHLSSESVFVIPISRDLLNESLDNFMKLQLHRPRPRSSNTHPRKRTMATHALPKLSLRRCAAAASTASAPIARTFSQLARQRAPPTTPMLDFLLPRVPSAPSHAMLRRAARSVAKPAPSRAFTASALRAATTAIYNSRRDDDGNDMTIEITPRAADVSPLPLLSLPHSLVNAPETKLTLTPSPAPQPNHSPRPEPPPRTAHHRRVGRVPRLPVPDVLDERTRNRPLDGAARGRRRGGRRGAGGARRG